MTVYSFNLYIWINSTVLVMGRDLFIFAMLSPAELKRPSKDPTLTGSIPEEDDDMNDKYQHLCKQLFPLETNFVSDFFFIE